MHYSNKGRPAIRQHTLFGRRYTLCGPGLNRIKSVLASGIIGLLFSTVSSAAERDYQFKDGISQEVLGNYLGRAITMNRLSYSDS
jgi:hypothetical protein